MVLAYRAYYIASVMILIMLLAAFHVQAQEQQLERPDGSLLYWQLERPETHQRQPILILAQGSGCTPAKSSQALGVVRTAFRDFAIITVEKYGVLPQRAEQAAVAGCSSEFYQHNTISQRIRDYQHVLDTVRESDWWNGQLFLFGGSAGAEVMARLMGPAKADAAVLLSLGGGRFFAEDMRDAILSSAGCSAEGGPSCPPVTHMFQQIRENPTSPAQMGGASFAYWADILDERAVDYILGTSTPILLIHGSQDQDVPVVSARKAVEVLVNAGRQNVTYWEYVGLDHQMKTETGEENLSDIVALAQHWLALKSTHLR